LAASCGRQSRSKQISAISLCKVGIFAGRAGDLLQFPPHVPRTRSPETNEKREKAGIPGAFFGLLGSLAKCRTGWLATQCGSHLSPRKFPANREFCRESCIFSALRACLAPRTPMLQALSAQFPRDLNRELFLGNREFFTCNREIQQRKPTPAAGMSQTRH
jgi:hypothetical protein